MAIDAFLKIDGIPGESTDDKHKDWIEVLSYSHNIDQPSSSASRTGGRTAERANLSDFEIIKELDKASPVLAVACCDGRHIKEVKLELCEASGEKHTYMVFTLEDVIIAKLRSSGAREGTKPLESVGLNFGKITWEYTPLGHEGRRGNKVGPMGWSLELNKKI